MTSKAFTSCECVQRTDSPWAGERAGGPARGSLGVALGGSTRSSSCESASDRIARSRTFVMWHDASFQCLGGNHA